MKLQITPDWLRKKIEEMEEAGIEEPYMIGPPMNNEQFLKVWIEGKIDHLEKLRQKEIDDIEARSVEENRRSIFANMGNTITLKYYAQIEVLTELKEFLEGLDKA